MLNVLTAINVRLDQMLPHQSEAISGQGILIGRIYRLYLHSPSSLNCAIDLGLGHGGLASRWRRWEGGLDGRVRTEKEENKDAEEEASPGCPQCQFLLI